MFPLPDSHDFYGHARTSSMCSVLALALLFALAAATALPAYVALGGAAGAGVALAGGWALGEELDALPLRAFRLVVAGIVLLAGLLIGLGVRGII